MSNQFITFINKTKFVADFFLSKGELVVAKMPGLAPGAELQVPTDHNDYQVQAKTTRDDHTYESELLSVAVGDSLNSEVVEESGHTGLTFKLIKKLGTHSQAILFQSATNTPVIYSLGIGGHVLQNVVLSNEFAQKTLKVGSVFYIYAIINGLTIPMISTSDAGATITALPAQAGEFILQIST